MRLVNGVLAESLSLSDRAIQFGDGVFRTMKVTAGQIEFWSQHYGKLASDCARLGMTAPSEATLLADIAQLQPIDHSIKIIVTRGESVRGYVTPGDIQPNRIVQKAALPVYPATIYTEGAVLRICKTRASWQPALAGVKHLNRLENVLARREWTDPNIFDGLMLDRDGYVVEGVMSNVFALIDGVWCTPTLNDAGVAGVYRDMLLLLNGFSDICTKEAKLTLAELYSASAIFVCNSLAACVPVRQIEQHRWPVDNEWMQHIQHILGQNK
ncbi:MULTISPECIES: aminodeoxychorismate lyase [Deefgea]|uniref:aminodeoxychorismate lyase n=1 Tax=Deefgea chitinilytica TaxID=570276 RepID=A0ABS2CD60_9NEIS|nr:MULTISPECIES: aminodeoxychorismate lyase [Deefgea]MBM5572060.1 aminodeoxychorismate lyase [Deefgea chitinilytica]MBM9889295.1 aminodeoxychorismate lyase [Deefgea sp. CFH1-16]